jgi:hypothetical protein
MDDQDLADHLIFALALAVLLYAMVEGLAR